LLVFESVALVSAALKPILFLILYGKNNQIMQKLQLNLFGKFEVQRADGSSLNLVSRKGKMLLAYLAICPDQKETRAQLSMLLWGDRFDEQARASLRQTLYDLRHLFSQEGFDIFSSEGDWVFLQNNILQVDVLQFEHLADAHSIPDLREALTTYNHNFAADLDLLDPGMGEWLDSYRSRLSETAYSTALRLTEMLSSQNLQSEAIETARKLVSLDPLKEQGHRHLMQLYASSGRRNEALRQYQICSSIARTELDVEPEPETTRLFEHIQTRKSVMYRAISQKWTSHRPTKRWGFVFSLVSILAFAIAATSIYVATPPRPLALPDKPSIAVFPFVDMTDNALRNYFSDGVTADIITKLSRVPDLFVIDQHSVFSYKNIDITTKRVAAELGVRYVLRGNIQSHNGRVRINAQLIDAISAQQIWAEQFERKMDNLFALQDDVTLRIVGAIQAETITHSAKLAFRKDTANLKAYDYVLRGRQYLFDLTPVSNRRARDLYLKAINLDSTYARAHAYLSWTHLNDMRMGWSTSAPLSLQLAFKNAARAVALDNFGPDGHEALGDAYLWAGQHDLAIEELNKALILNPSSASIYAKMGDILIWAGQPDEGMDHIVTAIRLNPHFPFTYVWHKAHAHFVAERYKEALVEFRNLKALKPDFVPTYLYLTAIYDHLEQPEDARLAFVFAASLQSGLLSKVTLNAFPYKDDITRKKLLSSIQRISSSL